MTNSTSTSVLAVLTALAARRGVAEFGALAQTLRAAGLADRDAEQALAECLAAGWIATEDTLVRMTSEGGGSLLVGCARLEAALDNSPTTAAQTECPSIPWLTTVQTEWIEALSINYAVRAEALQALLPAPLRPEVFHGSAWVQVLVSSLRDMRPQGLGSLFGVNFYQVSYRAAVCYEGVDGAAHRGGYFVRSETNHAVMQAVGNALAEFKFHAFGNAEIVLVREGNTLTAGIEPDTPDGRLVGVFETSPGSTRPPSSSVWSSLEELQAPLVECYDAYGVDTDNGWLYTLTIDRDPWCSRFVRPDRLYCEYFESGPLADGARLDSVLHIPRCGYRWRPLRREPRP